VYEYPIFTDHSAFERGAHAYTARLYGKGLCPFAEAILDTCVLLPVNEAYTEIDLEETAHAIRRVVLWFRSRNQK
jgi:dTDP-4-amino-4,6-dideoxygalactose transaminase